MLDPITDPDVLAGYLTDASNLQGHAEALFRPDSAEALGQILAAAQARAIPVTITAARTSTTGSPVPYGGWLVSTELLDRVLAIEHDTATAEAGVLLGAFQDAVEATGRFFPPDPTSRYDCTLGAAIACNASGAGSFKYGPARDWIEALQVVLPTGEIIEARRGDPVPTTWPLPAWTPPRVKTAAGYDPPRDLVDVFIGQEGTLGVITRATVRLTTRPDDVVGFLVFFPSRQAAVDGMRTLRTAARTPGSPVAPRCIEYLDAACLDLARTRAEGVPDAARAALFCEQEIRTGEDALEPWWELLLTTQALADDTVVADDPPGRRQLHALRHAIPAGINEQVVRNGMPKLGTDLAVPDDALDAMLDRYEAAPMDHVLFGHLGDNHLHLNLLPTTEAELELAKAFYDELAQAAIALGGTVSAEHGIGKIKRRQLRWMVGDDVLAGFAALKRTLDPAWILGRGTLLDAPG